MGYRYKNILNLQGEATAIRTLIHGVQHHEYGPGSIDFDAITPMPPWVFRGKVTDEIITRYGVENCRKSWCKAHWGVEGNTSGLKESADSYDGGNTLEFDTSGGDVRELMRKLSMIFPALTIDYLWASEDVGKDAGMVQFRDGEQLYEYIPAPLSSAAYELCFDIFAATAADYGLVYDPIAGTYHYDGSFIAGGDEHAETEN